MEDLIEKIISSLANGNNIANMKFSLKFFLEGLKNLPLGDASIAQENTNLKAELEKKSAEISTLEQKVKQLNEEKIDIINSVEFNAASIKSLENTVSKDKQVFAAKDTEISNLKEEITSYKKAIINLEDRFDAEDQYIRRESLLFSGDLVPSVKEGEDCVDEVCKLVSKIPGVRPIQPADISISHRLGPKPTSGVDKRTIVARFVRRATKYSILNGARRSKPQGIFINESLTKTRQNITRALRKAKQEFPDIVSGYSTTDGTIFAWVKSPNPNAPGGKNSKIIINTKAKLEEFCQRNFRLSAAHFLPPQTSRNDSPTARHD